MSTAYSVSRKVHRILVLAIVITLIAMGVTGLVLKYGSDDGTMRYIHNNLSPLFTIILVIMAVTGLYMYIHPWLARRRLKNRETNPAPTESK